MNTIVSGIKYRQLDIVLMPFPYSDLSGSKKRPALIVSNKRVNDSGDLICCLITSNPLSKGILLEEDFFEDEKLPYKSWVKANRLFTIEKKIIIKKIARIKPSKYGKILEEIYSNLKTE